MDDWELEHYGIYIIAGSLYKLMQFSTCGRWSSWGSQDPVLRWAVPFAFSHHDSNVFRPIADVVDLNVVDDAVRDVALGELAVTGLTRAEAPPWCGYARAWSPGPYRRSRSNKSPYSPIKWNLKRTSMGLTAAISVRRWTRSSLLLWSNRFEPTFVAESFRTYFCVPTVS